MVQANKILPDSIYTRCVSLGHLLPYNYCWFNLRVLNMHVHITCVFNIMHIKFLCIHYCTIIKCTIMSSYVLAVFNEPWPIPIEAMVIQCNNCSGRLRHGSTVSRTAAVSAHEYHLHINAHARDLFPYVLYCAMSQLVATKLAIDLRNRRRSFLTVWSDLPERLILLLHRFFWKKLIWSRIGER